LSSIHTLIPDILELLKTKGWMTETLAKELGDGVSQRIKKQFESEAPPSLRLSGMGSRCPKALWHSIHTPGEKEALPPWAHNKFSLGHFQEAYGIILCKAAGHRVEGEQHGCELDGVKGHIDAIVDGCVLDLKSCSGRQFNKYKTGTVGVEGNDSFGFLFQLDGYVTACRDDPLVNVKDRGYILAMHKELGHVTLYEHRTRPVSIRERIAEYTSVVARKHPPECLCETIQSGASGNVALGTRASYEPYKWCCNPNIRCFLYSDGPQYLTKVVRKPDVPEVDRFGKIINI
jgi:hypothetical protein